MTLLKEMLIESKDGEWGKDEELPDSTLMTIIRGTDFDDVRSGELSRLPQRFVLNRIASRKALAPNDIVLETAGGSKNRPTGRSLFIRRNALAKISQPVTCASFARFLRIDPEKAHPEYVYWLLQHLYESGILFKYHTQHTGVARFQYTTFSTTEHLSLPEFETQRRIASVLSAYDDLIENNTRRIAILEEMARRLYQEWFVHFRYPGHEKAKLVDSELGPIPKGWEVVPLGDLLVLQRGFDLPKKHRQEGPYPVFAATGQHGTHSQAKVKGPGVVTGRSGSLGTVTYVHHDFWPLNTTLWVKKFNKLTPIYAFHLLTAMGLEQYNSGAAVPTLNRNVVHMLPQLLPPRALLQRFDDYQQPIFALVLNLSLRNANLRTQRDLLLPKLISGELDVSDVSRPAAEAA